MPLPTPPLRVVQTRPGHPVGRRSALGCGRLADQGRRPGPAQAGFTVLELLVALSVIALLIAILVPAVLSVRAAARKVECGGNLKQIGIAIESYHSIHRMFPPGNSMGYSQHVFLLPHLDQGALFERADFSGDTEAHMAAVDALESVRLPVLTCPSDPVAGDRSLHKAPTNYAACFGSGVQTYGFNGMFQHLSDPFLMWKNGPVRAADVTDGLSNTAAMAEILIHRNSPSRLRHNWVTAEALSNPDQLEDFAEACRELSAATPGGPWAGRSWVDAALGTTMYNHILRPNQPSCKNGPPGYPTGAYTASSAHPGGVHVLFGDGRVKFVSEEIDRRTWRAMGSRNGDDVD